MFVETLLAYGSNPEWKPTLESVGRWVEGRPAAQLFRVNPRQLAVDLGLDDGLVTDAFLAGVVEGFFDLRWEFHCPHCHRVPHFASHLATSRATNYCPACQVDYRNQLDANVEVTFSATSKLASFADGEKDALTAAYNAAVGNGTWVKPEVSLSGLGLLHRPLFHERFGSEVLSTEESLEIRNVVLLFTDIKGSTMLYEQLGDAAAYHLVREHFKVLFRVIEAQGGIVVKTIGDAVMASFSTVADALEAALTVHEAILGLKVPGTEESVVVKMGLHGGPAIAVTLNDRFDYFGQTVNRAARIQGLAQDQEIYFSETVFRDPACRRTLAKRKVAVRRWRTQLKGIEGDQIVYSVR